MPPGLFQAETARGRVHRQSIWLTDWAGLADWDGAVVLENGEGQIPIFLDFGLSNARPIRHHSDPSTTLPQGLVESWRSFLYFPSTCVCVRRS